MIRVRGGGTRVVVAIAIAVGLGACTRMVVLEPPPDGGGELPDAFHASDGGGDGGVQDGGGLPDAGVIGDAALGG